jgi:Putative Actinobacterial Holin-X, holin superfamily III
MSPESDGRSLSDLLATALTQLSLLAQTEIRLARAEIGQKVSAACVGIGLIGLGAIFAISALVLLLMAVATSLTQYGLSAAFADAVAGVGGLIITVLLLAIGLSRLRVEALKPSRTLAQFRGDAAVAKDHLT